MTGAGLSIEADDVGVDVAERPAWMIRTEKFVSIAFGVTVIHLSARSIFMAPGEMLQTIGAVLGLMAGVLFIVRKPQKRAGTWGARVIALPSVVVGSALVARAYDAPIPPVAWAFIAIGGVLSVWAIGTLGRSFAILPSARDIVVKGPFRWIRHPAYTGQVVMLIGVIVVQRGHWIDMVLFAVAVTWMGVRAVVEERLLMVDPEYEAYADRVRWRVLPWVW